MRKHRLPKSNGVFGFQMKDKIGHTLSKERGFDLGIILQLAKGCPAEERDLKCDELYLRGNIARVKKNFRRAQTLWDAIIHANPDYDPAERGLSNVPAITSGEDPLLDAKREALLSCPYSRFWTEAYKEFNANLQEHRQYVHEA